LVLPSRFQLCFIFSFWFGLPLVRQACSQLSASILWILLPPRFRFVKNRVLSLLSAGSALKILSTRSNAGSDFLLRAQFSRSDFLQRVCSFSVWPVFAWILTPLRAGLQLPSGRRGSAGPVSVSLLARPQCQGVGSRSRLQLLASPVVVRSRLVSARCQDLDFVLVWPGFDFPALESKLPAQAACSSPAVSRFGFPASVLAPGFVFQDLLFAQETGAQVNPARICRS
jgi:hypothetical protein